MADEASKQERMVQEHLRKYSKANIDEYIQTNTFSDNTLHNVSTIATEGADSN